MPKIILKNNSSQKKPKRGQELNEEEKKKIINKTRAQQRVKMVNHVWTALGPLGLQQTWNEEAARKGKKGKNLFMEQTFFAYDPDLHIGMFNAMHFSTGKLLRLRNPFLVNNEDGSYTLAWQVNAEGHVASLDDSLRVIVIRESNPDIFIEIHDLDTRREDGQVTFKLPEKKNLTGLVHLYAFFTSNDGINFSPDDYFVLGHHHVK